MKNTFKAVEKVSFFILVALAFIGVIFLGTIVHELSHWNDLKEIAKDDYICLMDMPANGTSSLMNIRGTYYYSYDTNVPNWQEKAQTIDRYTELKAYTIEFVTIIGLFLICTAVVIWGRAQSSISYKPSQEVQILPPTKSNSKKKTQLSLFYRFRAQNGLQNAH